MDGLEQVDKVGAAMAAEPRKRTRSTEPNKVRIEGGIGYIELTDQYGDAVAEAIVDAADLDRVLAVGRWVQLKGGNTDYAVANIRYANGRRGQVKLHRVILGDEVATGEVVDHINHQGLDNRWSNLEAVTNEVNSQRRQGAQVNSTSGVRGVVWDKRDEKWKVQVKNNGRSINLGRYEDLADAKAVAIEGRRCLMPLARFSDAENEHKPGTKTRKTISEDVASRLRAWTEKHDLPISTGRIEAIEAIQDFEREGGEFNRDLAGHWMPEGDGKALDLWLPELRRRRRAIIEVLDTTRGLW